MVSFDVFLSVEPNGDPQIVNKSTDSVEEQIRGSLMLIPFHVLMEKMGHHLIGGDLDLPFHCLWLFYCQ